MGGVRRWIRWGDETFRIGLRLPDGGWPSSVGGGWPDPAEGGPAWHSSVRGRKRDEIKPTAKQCGIRGRGTDGNEIPTAPPHTQRQGRERGTVGRKQAPRNIRDTRSPAMALGHSAPQLLEIAGACGRGSARTFAHAKDFRTRSCTWAPVSARVGNGKSFFVHMSQRQRVTQHNFITMSQIFTRKQTSTKGGDSHSVGLLLNVLDVPTNVNLQQQIIDGVAQRPC